MLIIKEEGVKTPEFATKGSSGFDVTAFRLKTIYKGSEEIEEERLQKLQQSFLERGKISLRPGERALFGTGLTLGDLSKDKEIQSRPRSGISLKRGLIVVFGTIDSDYRGEMAVILHNTTPFIIPVEKDEKIAQFVVSNICKDEIQITDWTDEITDIVNSTERSSKGFGHSGK